MTSNFQSNAKQDLREIQILCKRLGAPITLRWTEWVNGQPTPDPVTGALLQVDGDLQTQSGTEDLDQETGSADAMDAPTERICKTKAFTHFVSPAMTTSRQFAEIQTGDCIMDFVVKLLRVVDGGDTNLVDGQVVDLFTLNAANRVLANGAYPAVPDTTEVSINDLMNVGVMMYKTIADQAADRNGQLWVQQKISDQLAQSWGVVYCGICFGQSILLRKAT
jgi:hypothetical protein